MLSQFLTESVHLEILKICNLQVTTSKKIVRNQNHQVSQASSWWFLCWCWILRTRTWKSRILPRPQISQQSRSHFKSICTRLLFLAKFENKQFHCGSIWCLGATKIRFRFLGGRPGWKESADRKRVPFQDGNFEASECCRICQENYPETKAWSIQSGYRSCDCTGCFFNWAPLNLLSVGQ